MDSAYFAKTGPSNPFSIESVIFFKIFPSGVTKKVAQPLDRLLDRGLVRRRKGEARGEIRLVSDRCGCPEQDEHKAGATPLAPAYHA